MRKAGKKTSGWIYGIYRGTKWSWFCITQSTPIRMQSSQKRYWKTKKKSDVVHTCYRFCQWPTPEPAQRAHKQGRRHSRNGDYTRCNNVLLHTQPSLTTVTSKCLTCSNRGQTEALICYYFPRKPTDRSGANWLLWMLSVLGGPAIHSPWIWVLYSCLQNLILHC